MTATPQDSPPKRTTPDDITAAVVASFETCSDERLQTVMRSLASHLHSFIKDVALTEEEWRIAIETLTATGHITDEQRQEWILWSDALGISMLVDAISHRFEPPATESTVLGPFYVPDSPLREYGDHLDEEPAGDALWVTGRVLSLNGEPLAGAELDVWQNGENELYAVQDPEAPDDHLRGKFRTRDDGSYGFIAVRPVPYPIPYDGPVGHMLTATGRHPWRPAHIHIVARAAGHQSVTTHVFDDSSKYLDSDAVFAVKPSLFRTIEPRAEDDPEKPGDITGPWFSLKSDFVLIPSDDPDEPVDPGRTA